MGGMRGPRMGWLSECMGLLLVQGWVSPVAVKVLRDEGKHAKERLLVAQVGPYGSDACYV